MPNTLVCPEILCIVPELQDTTIQLTEPDRSIHQVATSDKHRLFETYCDRYSPQGTYCLSCSDIEVRIVS